MGLFSSWIEVVLKPKEVLQREKQNASIGKGILAYLVLGIINGIILGVFIAILGVIFSALMPIPGLTGAALGGIIIGLIVAIIVSSIVISLIWHLILFVIARLLGGKGSFTEHYYLTSLPVVILGIVGMILAIIPLIGALLALLVFLYSLYILTLAIREAHGFTTGKAIITWLLPAIVITLIGIAVLASLIAGLGGLGALFAAENTDFDESFATSFCEQMSSEEQCTMFDMCSWAAGNCTANTTPPT